MPVRLSVSASYKNCRTQPPKFWRWKGVWGGRLHSSTSTLFKAPRLWPSHTGLNAVSETFQSNKLTKHWLHLIFWHKNVRFQHKISSISDSGVKICCCIRNLTLFYFITQKVTGDTRRGRWDAEEVHLNFRRFELCLASKPCTTPCNPIQGSMGKQDPLPVCGQSGL